MSGSVGASVRMRECVSQCFGMCVGTHVCGCACAERIMRLYPVRCSCVSFCFFLPDIDPPHFVFLHNPDEWS